MTENPEHKKSRSVSLLDVDAASINRSQLNSSSSKMQYSIGKANRFPREKKKYTSSNAAISNKNFMTSLIPSLSVLLLLGMERKWS